MLKHGAEYSPGFLKYFLFAPGFAKQFLQNSRYSIVLPKPDDVLACQGSLLIRSSIT
jgi:hypothetical protein